VGSATHFVVDHNVVARTLGPLVVSAIGGSLLLVAVGGFLVGGPAEPQPWARTVAIVLGILACSILLRNGPGHLLLWVLLSDEGGA